MANAFPLQAANRPMSERTLLMSWHGQHAHSSRSEVRMRYKLTNETVRIRLLGLANFPDVSIGDPVPDYADILGNSMFCLCPQGSGTYSSRVFEALLAGCVPVI